MLKHLVILFLSFMLTFTAASPVLAASVVTVATTTNDYFGAFGCYVQTSRGGPSALYYIQLGLVPVKTVDLDPIRIQGAFVFSNNLRLPFDSAPTGSLGRDRVTVNQDVRPILGKAPGAISLIVSSQAATVRLVGTRLFYANEKGANREAKIVDAFNQQEPVAECKSYQEYQEELNKVSINAALKSTLQDAGRQVNEFKARLEPLLVLPKAFIKGVLKAIYWIIVQLFTYLSQQQA